MHGFADVPRILFKRFLLEAPVSGDLPAAVVQKVDLLREDRWMFAGMCCDVCTFRWNKVKETFRQAHKPEMTCTPRGL